eukprot:8745317-Alexandrium_andersonii.AAC.1
MRHGARAFTGAVSAPRCVARGAHGAAGLSLCSGAGPRVSLAAGLLAAGGRALGRRTLAGA